MDTYTSRCIIMAVGQRLDGVLTDRLLAETSGRFPGDGVPEALHEARMSPWTGPSISDPMDCVSLVHPTGPAHSRRPL